MDRAGKTGSRLRHRLARALVLACALALPAPASATLPSDFFGIYWENVHPPFDFGRVVEIRAQRNGGFGLLRQPFDWSMIERHEGRFDLAAYDDFMVDAAAARLQVLPFLVDPPDWAAAGKDENLRRVYPPRDPELIGPFAARLAARYGAGGAFWREHPELPYVPIRSWQIWNEPNIRQWWWPTTDPVGYTRLLAAASRAIKGVDPGAEVVTAGVPQTGGAVPLLEWIDALYDAGARGTFDALAVHPYAEDASGSVRLLEQVREVMDRRGDARTAIWATELGWATGGPNYMLVTSEAGQADRISEVVRALVARRGALRLRGLVYYSWRDSEPLGRDVWYVHAGLLKIMGDPKPGFFAFRDAIARAWAGTGGAPELPGGGTYSRTIRGYALELASPRRVRLTRSWRLPLEVRCGAEAVFVCVGWVTVESKSWSTRAAGPAQRKFHVDTGATDRVSVRLSTRAKRRIRRDGRVRIRARATSLDANGRLGEAARTIVLLRPRGES
jgi:hypothetical protein